ncbi:MAG: methyltransferase domain-containing protein [Candidatus Omnitrophica bacterium]|nr:methyltransferase domain-containing protein [Candidatus Omnitrophota bacterium]
MNSKHRHGHEGVKQQKQGVSSFNMQDSKLVFGELKLNEGDFFLDLGCGAGDYSIQAAKTVGRKGKVYALDQWQEVIESISEKADAQGLININSIKSNIISSLPIEDKVIDVCLLAQVLHGFNLSKDAKILFTEISRVLKPGGRLAILEFTNKDVGFGPPMRIRLSPEKIETAITQHGFKKISLVNYGCSYLIQFRKL